MAFDFFEDDASPQPKDEMCSQAGSFVSAVKLQILQWQQQNSVSSLSDLPPSGMEWLAFGLGLCLCSALKTEPIRDRERRIPKQ